MTTHSFLLPGSNCDLGLDVGVHHSMNLVTVRFFDGLLFCLNRRLFDSLVQRHGLGNTPDYHFGGFADRDLNLPICVHWHRFGGSAIDARRRRELDLRGCDKRQKSPA
ncbi:MAG: hypothetical protein R3C56_22100 [Pirellulaceae bacterium]